MNGLATRQKLHAATHPELEGDASHLPQWDEDAHYEFVHGRASAKLRGIDFGFPDRPFMPNFGPGNLGTPGERERTEEGRLGRLYSQVFVIGVAFILAMAALGYVNSQPLKPPRAQPADVQVPKFKQATRLAAGTSRYELDRQGCLIGMHKEVAGVIRNTSVSYHC